MISVLVVVPQPPAVAGASIGAIVGGIVGGLAVVGLAMGYLRWRALQRRRRQRKQWRGARGRLILGKVGKKRGLVAGIGPGGASSIASSTQYATGVAGGGLFGGVMNFFSNIAGPDERKERYVARSLVLGQPEIAAAGLKVALGLDDDLELARLLGQGISIIEEEFKACGSEDDVANLRYCLEGKACDKQWMPPHVMRAIESGWYHGGRILEDDFDYGHQGKDLNDFCNAKESKVAGLSRANVLALRLCASR